MVSILEIFDEAPKTRSTFRGGFPRKKNEKVQEIFFVHGISLCTDADENKEESGNTTPRKQFDEPYRIEFLKLLRKCKNSKKAPNNPIVGAVEILGDEKLLECYVDKNEAKKISEQWLDNNDKIIKKLINNKANNSNFFQQKQQQSQKKIDPPLSWDVLSSYSNQELNISYDVFFKQAQEDYKNEAKNTDINPRSFKEIVDELAEEHKGKSKHKNNDGGFEDAKNYIFHECSGYLVAPYIIRGKYKELKKDVKIVCTYPTKKFNDAILWQLKARKSELGYQGYKLHVPEKKKIRLNNVQLQSQAFSPEQTIPKDEFFMLVNIMVSQTNKPKDSVEQMQLLLVMFKACEEYLKFMDKMGITNFEQKVKCLTFWKNNWGNNKNNNSLYDEDSKLIMEENKNVKHMFNI